jgi:RNA polymerase sigma-70 factor (ECF subfamily)
MAYRVVGNLQDAEDVRQIVLLKLAGAAGQIADPARFSGWVRRCTVNEAVSWLRGRRGEAKRRKTFDEAVASEQPPPPEAAMIAEQTQRLQQALNKLESDDRALVSLRFDEGMTIRHIAETLEKPPMTVHSQLDRAVGRLRRLLGSDIDSDKDEEVT